MDKKLPTAVVFDMDGVIFNTEYLLSECWMKIGEKYSLKDLYRGVIATIGINKDAARKVMKDLYGEDFEYDKYIDETRALFAEIYGADIPKKKGVTELLKFLKAHDIPVALASSTGSRIVEKEICDAGIREYFDELVCGDMVARSKPFPDIFLEACRRLGADPGGAFGIEDSYNGVRALNAAGMRAIMVPDMLPATDEMEKLAEVILPDLFAVKSYISDDAGL